MEHDKQCILVIIGADQWGRKELLAIADGYRESAQSWRELLLDLKRRGNVEVAPELAVGQTERVGFSKAWCARATARSANSACWLHKTGNVLNKLPASPSKPRPRGAPCRTTGSGWPRRCSRIGRGLEKAFDFFLEAYGAKYDKATACLERAGPRGAAHLLRLSGRALEAPAH